MKNYKQLTLAQRYEISLMYKNGCSVREITEQLNRTRREEAIERGLPLPAVDIHVSTIYRELKRNRMKRGGYNAVVAHEIALERRQMTSQNRRISPLILNKAINLLKKERWSPEQISAVLAKDGYHISIERIYQHIRANLTELAKYTHHHMKYRHHQAKIYRTAGKSMIPDRVSIHERPPEANGKRFGDWEMDLVMGAEQKSAILTIIERSTNLFMQKKLKSKRPEDVARAVKDLLIPYKKNILTITTDNGMEFRNHKDIANALDCKIYFADPYCSGQKGAVENSNKIFREFFPKGTDFRNITQHQLDQVQYQINRRPRKKLAFSTPKIEFYKQIT